MEALENYVHITSYDIDTSIVFGISRASRMSSLAWPPGQAWDFDTSTAPETVKLQDVCQRHRHAPAVK